MQPKNALNVFTAYPNGPNYRGDLTRIPQDDLQRSYSTSPALRIPGLDRRNEIYMQQKGVH